MEGLCPNGERGTREGESRFDAPPLPQSPISFPPKVRCISDPSQIVEPTDGRKLFLIGGAQVFAALLPRCNELLLTHVHGDFTGDAFFPPYEKDFRHVETLYDDAQMAIRRYERIQ